MQQQRSAIYTIESPSHKGRTNKVVDTLLHKIMSLIILDKPHNCIGVSITRLGEEEFILQTKSSAYKHTQSKSFLLSRDRRQMIEQLLSTLYKCIIAQYTHRHWNKAYLTMDNKKHYQFSYRFDHGIQWLKYVNPANPALLLLDINTLHKMSSWEELSDNYSRT